MNHALPVSNSRADTAPTPQRLMPLVGVVWMLLVINTLGSGGEATIIPIPRLVAQMFTMGSLGIAFVLALILNPRLRIRPNAFLFLLTLLVVSSSLSSAFLEAGVGGLMRAARLAVFVATLWLLTPWWDGSLTLVRYHLRTLWAVVVLVIVGFILAPGLATPPDYDGRLVGVIWYLPPPQVAQFAAGTAGLALVLWLGRCLRFQSVVLIALPAIVVLILTHTRTATVGLVAGLAVSALMLTLSHARARKTVVASTVGAALIAVAFGTALLSWFRRGQDEAALTSLTGRAKVWDALLAEPRTLHDRLLGVGLGDKSFEGLPIDSGWLAMYHEQGLVGVAIAAAFLAALLYAVVTRPPSAGRACGAFLVVYCAIASYTEVGISDASTYLLHLAVAASLLPVTYRDAHPFRQQLFDERSHHSRRTSKESRAEGGNVQYGY